MPNLNETEPHLVLTIKYLCDMYGEAGVLDTFSLMRIQGLDTFPSIDMDEGPKTFSTELAGVLNKYSKENNGNTPDFILATFLERVLSAYGVAVSRRDAWFGIDVWDKTFKEAFIEPAAPTEVTVELPDDDQGGHPSV